MAIKLFVAGLSYATTDAELSEMFAPYGSVVSAKVVTDRETNRSKGFGFVELSDESESKAAIEGLNGKDMGGRPLTVTVARPREDRSSHSNQDRRNTVGNNYRRSYR